jgi:hypothetical protein
MIISLNLNSSSSTSLQLIYCFTLLLSACNSLNLKENARPCGQALKVVQVEQEKLELNPSTLQWYYPGCNPPLESCFLP